VIGAVSAVADGCGPPGECLHWGAIRGDVYIDPLSLLALPKVRLLPIWTDGLPLPPVSPPLGSTAAALRATTTPALVAGPPEEGGTGVGAGVGVAAGAGIAAGAAGLWRARRARLIGAQASSARKVPAL